MSDPFPMVFPSPKRWALFRILKYAVVVLGILFVVGMIALGPVDPGGRRHPESGAEQQVFAVGLAMYSYAQDNAGKYPDGKSSTEVFQKLLDGEYIYDPAMFYIPLPGKREPIPGKKLKPENVCFDVTSNLETSSPSGLPVIFMTGNKVTYASGGNAVPLIKPYPNFMVEPRTGLHWMWYHDPEVGSPEPGIAVLYKSNQPAFKKLENLTNSDSSIPNFISPDFKPDGKTYRQLTPEGVLPGN